jgi:hypothetical protein
MPYSSRGLLNTPTDRSVALGTSSERRADLPRDHPGERHCGCGQVGVMQGMAVADRVAGVPAGAQQHEEESGHLQDSADQAEEEPGAQEHRWPDRSLKSVYAQAMDDAAEVAVTWWCPECGGLDAPQPCLGSCLA